MSAEAIHGASMTKHLRLDPIARWSVPAVFLLTVVVGWFAVSQPGKVTAAAYAFFVPLSAFLGLVSIGMWRSRLDLGPTEIRRRGLLRTRVVALTDVERVSFSKADTGGDKAHVHVAGRSWPMTIDLRYWERTMEIRAYLDGISSDRRTARDVEAPAAAPLVTEADAVALDARRRLSRQRWPVLLALAGILGLLVLATIVATRRSPPSGVIALAAAGAVGGFVCCFAVRFAHAVPRRWRTPAPAEGSNHGRYAEVLVEDLRDRDLPARLTMRSDGELAISDGGITWTGRADSLRVSIDATSVDGVLMGPAAFNRWFVVVRTPAGDRRFYVAEPVAVAQDLHEHGFTARMMGDI